MSVLTTSATHEAQPIMATESNIIVPETKGNGHVDQAAISPSTVATPSPSQSTHTCDYSGLLDDRTKFLTLINPTDAEPLGLRTFGRSTSGKTIAKNFSANSVEQALEITANLIANGEQIHFTTQHLRGNQNHGKVEAGSTNKDYVATRMFCLDVDAKDHPDQRDHNGEIPIPDFHLTPTCVSRSGGGGYHAMWFLTTPVDLSEPYPNRVIWNGKDSGPAS
jgi:hypothetical protein